jgi:hypothetical protein
MTGFLSLDHDDRGDHVISGCDVEVKDLIFLWSSED